jgi:hypothetical protein
MRGAVPEVYAGLMRCVCLRLEDACASDFPHGLARVPEDPCFLAPLTPNAMCDEIIILHFSTSFRELGR